MRRRRRRRMNDEPQTHGAFIRNRNVGFPKATAALIVLLTNKEFIGACS